MPQKTKITQIVFPLGGVNTSLGYQSQPPYTTCDASNVRGRERSLDRLTGGSRPGLVRYASIGSNKPQLLDGVTVMQDDGFSIWEDSFQYDSMSHYSAMTGTPNSALLVPTIESGSLVAADNYRYRSFALPAIAGFDSTKAFRFGVYRRPGDSSATGGPERIQLFFGTATPGSATDSYYIMLVASSNTYSISAYRRVAGVDSQISTTTSVAMSLLNGSGVATEREGWFEADVSGTTLKVYLFGSLAATYTLPVAVSSSQTYLGVVLRGPATGKYGYIDRVRLQYRRSYSSDLTRQRLVSVQNGVLYRENYIGGMTATNSSTTFSTTAKLASAEIAQKLYILDDSKPLVAGTAGVVSGGVFSDAAVSSWASYFTTATKDQFYLSVKPRPASTASGILNTRAFFTDKEILDSPYPGVIFQAKPGRANITLTATGGTVTLGSTANITISAGADGSSTVTFNSSRTNPTSDEYESDIRSACNNLRFDATATNITSAEIQVTASLWYQFSLPVTKPLGGEVIISRRRYDISAVSGGNLTLSGATLAGTALEWSLYRYPKVYDITADEDSTYSIRSGTGDGQFRVTTEGTNPDTFTVGTIANWDTNLAGIDISKYEIQRLSGGVVQARYDIVSAPATAYLKISKNEDPLGTQSSKDWRIVRKDAISRWKATRGEVPTGCTLIARYQDRLVLAGSALEPSNWYMSRVSDETDFSYVDADVAAAVTGSNSQAGTIGEPITALMPYNDDNFFFGAQNSLWLLRGAPSSEGGGRIDNVSYKIGVVSGTSWCHGPAGEMIWLSRDGIWSTNPTCLSCEPVSVSREKLPRELLDINPQMYDISMAYDVRDRGVHIFLTPNVATASACPASVKHWFLHWESKAFWPVRYASKSHNPVFAKQVSSPSAEDSRVVLAGLGGNLLRHSSTSSLDEEYQITSYVDIGPINMSQDGFSRGMMRSLDVVMADAADDTTWKLYGEDTPESAVSSQAAFQTGTFTEADQYTSYPMMSASAWRLRIESTGGWAFSSAVATVTTGGRERKLG